MVFTATDILNAVSWGDYADLWIEWDVKVKTRV